MAVHVVRVARRTVERLPSPVVGLVVRIGGKILLPIAGAAAAAALRRARWRIAARTSPDGTVVIDINRGLRTLAPVSGTPAEPLVALAERAHVTLAGVPGGSVTHLRAVPKLAGDDIRADVALAKERLEAGELASSVRIRRKTYCLELAPSPDLRPWSPYQRRPWRVTLHRRCRKAVRADGCGISCDGWSAGWTCGGHGRGGVGRVAHAVGAADPSEVGAQDEVGVYRETGRPRSQGPAGTGVSERLEPARVFLPVL